MKYASLFNDTIDWIKTQDKQEKPSAQSFYENNIVRIHNWTIWLYTVVMWTAFAGDADGEALPL